MLWIENSLVFLNNDFRFEHQFCHATAFTHSHKQRKSFRDCGTWTSAAESVHFASTKSNVFPCSCQRPAIILRMSRYFYGDHCTLETMNVGTCVLTPVSSKRRCKTA